MRVLAVIFLVLAIFAAWALHGKARATPITHFNGDRYAAEPTQAGRMSLPRGLGREIGRAARSRGNRTGGLGAVIGGRPAGCPARFCGCGASLHLFGRIIPHLNLAANWLRFPRAEPAPNMVAARRGHVFVLKRHIGGRTWLVHDSNSGGRRTRIHPRSIAGYAIVNPHGRS